MSEDTFTGWAVLELLGHRKIAGLVREVTIAGAGLLRIDVYSGEATEPIQTQFYPPSLLYCLTPITEQLARRYAKANQELPVTRYDLPMLPPPSDLVHVETYNRATDELDRLGALIGRAIQMLEGGTEPETLALLRDEFEQDEDLDL